MTYSCPFALWVSLPPEMPMRSQVPLAMTPSVSISMSWYLSEELPALMTKIFIFLITPYSLAFYLVCSAVMATAQTMSLALQPRERSLSGFAKP